MAVERIAAEFVYTLDCDQPIKNGYVEYDTENGTILSVGQCEAGEQVQYVSKLELIAHPEAADCENWEELIARLYPEHDMVLIGERNIVIRPRQN